MAQVVKNLLAMQKTLIDLNELPFEGSQDIPFDLDPISKIMTFSTQAPFPVSSKTCSISGPTPPGPLICCVSFSGHSPSLGLHLPVII